MSLEAMVWAWKRPVNDQMELLLLLALSDYANQDNECWPGYERLLEKTRIRSRATLAKKLIGLEEAGLIERQKRPIKTGGSKTTVYRVNTEGEWPSSAYPKVHEVNSRESSSPVHPKVQQVNSRSTVNQLDRTSQLYIYSDSFTFWWSIYPNRQGEKGNKKKTFRQYQKIQSEGFTDQHLIDAAIRYTRYCTATGKVGTEFIKLTTTFLNDSDNITNQWTVNHENRQSTYSNRSTANKKWADAIFNAPGCESLSEEDQADIFGERPVQDNGDSMANKVPEHVPGQPIGECQK